MIKTRTEILRRAQCVEPDIWRQHLTGFIDAFIMKGRRDRCRFLLLNPSVKTSRTSHKLYDEATIVASNTDGIYSFIAGELAIFWFHEGEVFLFDTRSSTR